MKQPKKIFYEKLCNYIIKTIEKVKNTNFIDLKEILNMIIMVIN